MNNKYNKFIIQYKYVSNIFILISNFYYMKKYSDKEISLLSLQVGCTIRLERLRKGLSQEDLGLAIGSNSTMIGRIERAENVTAWQNLLKVSQELDINYNSLFLLKSIGDIILMVKECLSLETKLTTEKLNYYRKLEKSLLKDLD